MVSVRGISRTAKSRSAQVGGRRATAVQYNKNRGTRTAQQAHARQLANRKRKSTKQPGTSYDPDEGYKARFFNTSPTRMVRL